MPLSPKLTLPLFAAVGVALAALAIAATATQAAGNSAETGSASCTKRTVPGQRPKHTDNVAANGKWNSFPPTSGLHYYLPAKFNWYPQPIPQIVVIHNLEHGGIGVSYGSKVPAATLRKLRAWYQRDTNAVIVTPLPSLGKRIALTAWNAPPYAGDNPDPGIGVLMTCTAFDEKAFTRFRKVHRYKGGERFPMPTLARQP